MILGALNIYKFPDAFTYDAMGVYNAWKMI